MNLFNNSCGGNCGNCGNFGNNFGGNCDCCSLILWIIILQCLCGNGNGCGIDCCTLILLLLLCGGCGNSCGKQC